VTRRLTTAVAVAVLVTSGLYVLVYLFRWQWHRAIITGIFFLAAELALAMTIVLRKIRGVEDRLAELTDAVERATPTDPVLERLRSTAPEPANPFAWLDPKAGTTNIFLPFLLGIGAVASGLAWVVEHVARRTAVPVLEQRLADALRPLAPPADGLVGTGPAPVTPPAKRHRGRTAGVVVAGLVTSVVAAGLIDVLADAIQTRPDTTVAEATTIVEIEMRGAAADEQTTRRASELWGTCGHATLGTRATGAEIELLAAGRVAVRVPAHIGYHAEQRLRGCLQDAVVDRVQANVVDVEHLDADGREV
jgi:hypothetical protein